jgi:hypothetical protein
MTLRDRKATPVFGPGTTTITPRLIPENGVKNLSPAAPSKTGRCLIRRFVVAALVVGVGFRNLRSPGIKAVRLEVATKSEKRTEYAFPPQQNTIQNEQRQALNSLAYYVDGDWVVAGGKNISSLAAALHVGGGEGSKNHSRADFTSNSSQGKLDALYFVPRRLLPIPSDNLTTSNETNHANANSTTEELDSIILEHGVEFHRFTFHEARSCMANKKILLLGDSHMRNIWRALNDLLTDHGTPPHDYHRWDGYQLALTDPLPSPLTSALAEALLPGALFARSSDHSRIGVPGACVLKNDTSSDSENFYTCQSQKNMKRRSNDLRTLDCDACKMHNIELDASWCASSLTPLLNKDPSGKTNGDVCRDSRNAYTRTKPQTSSQLEHLLLESNPTYDLVVAGFHVHDVKMANCKAPGRPKDHDECRQELSRELIQNAEEMAKFAQDHGIPLLWITSGPLNLNLIPKEYHRFQQDDDRDRQRRAMASIMRSHGHAVLDAFHMADSCRRREQQVKQAGGKWPSCLSDGMHGSRYLDRMRAHMILNWQCPDAM